jgi:EmrB/QacA subfamily drug resistance transporter
MNGMHASAGRRSTAASDRVVLALLCVAQFIVVLDVTIVAIALPPIQRDLGFAATDLQWVVTAYTLVFAGFLVLAGRVADIHGRRKWFLIGLCLFSVSSLLCGVAASASLLVAARCVQGLGAAIVAPAALSILTSTFTEEHARRRAVGVWTAAAAGGGAAGWLLGGVLTQTLGWRWVFLVNVPVGLVAAVLARSVLAESRSTGDDRGLDLAGAVAVTSGLALLVFGCTQIEQRRAAAPMPWAVLAAAGVVLWAFVRIEARAANPLLPLDLARTRAFAGANVVALVLTATTTPPLFFCVLYLQQVRDLAPIMTGVAFAPANLAVIAGSVTGPRLADRLGNRRAMAAGLIMVAAGAVTIAAVLGGGRLTIAALVGAFVVLGGGLGVASVASTAQGITAAGEQRGGVASGILNTAAQVGTVVGLAVLVSLAAARTASFGVTLPEQEALVAGYRWAAAGAALLAAATGAMLVRHPHAR